MTGRLDPTFLAFHSSLPFDRRLLEEDLTGSAAWTLALVRARVLRAAEGKKLVAAIEKLRRQLRRDPRALLASDAEDVHSFVEAQLQRLAGDLARRLHTGRSRNDQVATDLKLWLRQALARLHDSTSALMRELVTVAERHAASPMPGYTHLQRAQPVTIGHHALAYVEMLERDRERISDCAARMDSCPLGSGALAGTAYPIDRAALARSLGFTRGPTRNSLDAVADRDHVAEALFCCALVMTHLSRLAEDWIFFASQEAGYLHFGDEVSTGSSLMPQKKNPDAFELIRGKAGRVLGRLSGLLTTLKALPLAYDKDLQEDKEALFEAIDTTDACLRVAAVAVKTARFDLRRARAQAERGCLNATDLADQLVRRGVPFRDAHQRASRAVRRALALGVELQDLPAAERARLVPELPGDWRAALALDAVLARRDVAGGTAPRRVRQQAAGWRQALRGRR
jgi:argininosuccinate lyase